MVSVQTMNDSTYQKTSSNSDTIKNDKSNQKRTVVVGLEGTSVGIYALKWAIENVINPKEDQLLLVHIAKVDERENPEGGYHCITGKYL
jgi:hypothetical protein